MASLTKSHKSGIFKRFYLTVALFIGLTFIYVFSDYINLKDNLNNLNGFINWYGVIRDYTTDNDGNQSVVYRDANEPYYQPVFDFSHVRWYPVPANPDPMDRWTILVQSAYYDHRIEKIVVLLASDAAGLLHKQVAKYSFICVLFYDNETDGNATYVETEGYFYTSYLFYCPLNNNERKFNQSFDDIPKSLTIQRNDSIDTLSATNNWTIPIVNLLERKDRLRPKQRTLALCVGIMFGYQDWLTLIQYIEFHRIQGVEKFFFFYHDMHWSSEEILRWYTRKFDNLVELVYWNPNHVTCRNDYRCQLLRDNTCSYALMYKYKYVGDMDFDELFTPVQGKLTDLLMAMDRPDRGSFQFRAKYHQTLTYDTPVWENVSADNVSEVVGKFLPLFRYINVSTYAGHFYSPKTITKPETVLKRWIHYVANHVKGTALYLVNEKSEGFMRHFKIRKWWGGWAENADQEVKYKFVDIENEVGKPLLQLVVQNVQSTALQIKAFMEKDER